MEHKYGSYSIAAPTIKDPMGAVEDVSGGLRTTKTLTGSLLGDVEGMIDLAREAKERPGSISPDAVEGRLDAAWALAQAVDERLMDSIILLDAIVDHHNEHQGAAYRAWHPAITDVLAKKKVRDAADAPGSADRAYCSALDRLTNIRVPDVEALRLKVQLLQERWEGFEFPDDALKAIIADAEFLAHDAD